MAYHDLTAALKELEAEPIKVKVKGEKFEFRPTISTKLVLRLTAMAENNNLDNADALFAFWKQLFGEQNFERLVDVCELSIREMSALQDYLLTTYGVQSDEPIGEALTEDDPQ